MILHIGIATVGVMLMPEMMPSEQVTVPSSWQKDPTH